MYYSTADEMEKLDDLAVANGLEVRQMMELAGWHMLSVFSELKIKSNQRIVIVSGKGNKGGDGLAATRHLFNYGYKNISVVVVSGELKEDPKHHLRLLQKMNIDIVVYQEDKEKADDLIKSSDIIIDSLIGYHLVGNPRGEAAELIEMINVADKKVISYDMPSGVDATTGECFKPCIKADATLTLALSKKVFQTESGQAMSGVVFLGDIGIPEMLYDQISQGSRPSFARTGLLSV